MTTYKLHLHFSPNDLRTLISNGYHVVIVKDLGFFDNRTPVAWLAVRPRADNVVTWEEEYGIYSSLTTPERGARIEIMSITGLPASRGKFYELNSSGRFGPPQDGVPAVPADVYEVHNQYDTPNHLLTLGLYQRANVDGTPLDRNVASVVQVPFPVPARLVAAPSVFLMVSRAESGTVVSSLDRRTSVSFGSETEASLTYNLNDGYFERSGGRSKEGAGGLVVEHLPPEPPK
ncbi:MAG TPA: hypothetical protein VGG20_17720 [Thermoanaerobaculia bacterium]|jgi:hypothetical protein